VNERRYEYSPNVKNTRARISLLDIADRAQRP